MVSFCNDLKSFIFVFQSGKHFCWSSRTHYTLSGPLVFEVLLLLLLLERFLFTIWCCFLVDDVLKIEKQIKVRKNWEKTHFNRRTDKLHPKKDEHWKEKQLMIFRIPVMNIIWWKVIKRKGLKQNVFSNIPRFET